MDGLPASITEAARLGAAFYFTGLPCKRGHICRRHANGQCEDCRRLTNAQSRARWRKKNPEKHLQEKREYYWRRPEHFRARAIRRYHEKTGK